ncbi:MAG TPA: anaerobic C4-dicarboxylate transporter family protein [Actinomycetes bacterium]|nr:anaerobic C4-dicarboxylate transporter family protein [Actinomycetes bacterium]
MSEGWQAVLEGAVVLLAIFLGVRTGGIGLGLWGAAGTAVLSFVFGADPGVPPVDAFFIILAVITASAVMQAAGGIDWLVSIASRIIDRCLALPGQRVTDRRGEHRHDGTTRLSKVPIWHSFTIPMLVSWVVVVFVGLLIARVLF